MERSIPPEIMTMVIPAASTALMATWRVTLSRLAVVKKRSLKREAKATITSRTSSIP